jgi:elongation factor P--(R)-beta-lysine ligase
MSSLHSLREHFELRKTRSLGKRKVCARLFRWEEAWGLADDSGALWPVQCVPDDTGSNCPLVQEGDVVVGSLNFSREDGAGVSKYEDLGFLARFERDTDSLETCSSLTSSEGTWPLSGVPSPLDLPNAQWKRVQERLLRPHSSRCTLFLENALVERNKNISLRNQALARAQSYFENRGFLRCETPSLVPSGGVESYLHIFSTSYEDHRGKMHPLNLPTSPEFALKKLLVEGHQKVFQIARAFRNRGELSQWHEPEFFMLEWYRTGATMLDIQHDVQGLVRTLHAALGSLKQEENIVQKQWPIFTCEELFRLCVGIELTQVQDPEMFYGLAKKVSISVREGDDWDAIFCKIFLDKIEPFLATHPACFVQGYPTQMGALAQKAENPLFVQRFEAYLFGIEICNGYQELTDAHELKSRFAATQQQRVDLVSRDSVFEQAMDYGLPPCAGVALGLDRVTALLTGRSRIQELMAVPFASQFARGEVALE